MTTRPIQAGDIAQINVQGVNYDIVIDRVDPQAIYASSYVIIPQGSTWQVQNYALPHTVTFLPSISSISVPKSISSPSFVPTPKSIRSPSFVSMPISRPITIPISVSKPVIIPVPKPITIPTSVSRLIPIPVSMPKPTIPVPKPVISPITIPVSISKPTTTSISPRTSISSRITPPISIVTPIEVPVIIRTTTPITTPITTPTPIATPIPITSTVPEEPPTFAVYSRTGPRKILLFLQPRRYKVTYTPAGIQFLNIDRNKLPSYVLITNLLAQRANDLVLIPYVKDRPQAETEWLIWNQLIPLEYNIVDIIPSERGINNPVPVFEKSQVFAVYSRTGPRKILMLLEPGLHKLTYTPVGIQFLNLNRDKLPSYELATNLLVRQAQDFVLVLYIKGRSEQEIERLMSEQPEYSIADIFSGGIYTGVYGNIAPVGKTLQSVTFCQGKHYFMINQAPRGTEWYAAWSQFFEGSTDIDPDDPGMFVLGKNGDYIITSTATFAKILSDIRKCGRVYYLIGTTKDIGKFNELAETSHAMAIVIDPEEHLCEVMDPNGISPDTRHVYFWITKLVDYLRHHGIDVERKITVDEPFCPQGLAAFAPEFKKEQQCLAVAFWYIWLRVNNLTVPPEAIRRYMMKMTPQEAYDRISRVATIAFGS